MYRGPKILTIIGLQINLKKELITKRHDIVKYTNTNIYKHTYAHTYLYKYTHTKPTHT